MIRNARSTSDFTSLHSRASEDALGYAEPSKIRARLIVDTVATLRILVPVALITAIVVSGRLPEPPIETAMAAIADTAAVSTVAAQSYFPGQFVNQGAGAEEHVPNF